MYSAILFSNIHSKIPKSNTHASKRSLESSVNYFDLLVWDFVNSNQLMIMYGYGSLTIAKIVVYKVLFCEYKLLLG